MSVMCVRSKSTSPLKAEEQAYSDSVRPEEACFSAASPVRVCFQSLSVVIARTCTYYKPGCQAAAFYIVCCVTVCGKAFSI